MWSKTIFRGLHPLTPFTTFCFISDSTSTLAMTGDYKYLPLVNSFVALEGLHPFWPLPLTTPFCLPKVRPCLLHWVQAYFRFCYQWRVESQPQFIFEPSFQIRLQIIQKTIINGGTVINLLQIWRPPLRMISSSNFWFASNLYRSFFRRCECRDCIKTQFLVLSCVLLFLGNVSAWWEQTCLDTAPQIFACLPPAYFVPLAN